MDAAACFDRFRLRFTAAQQIGDGESKLADGPARREAQLSREPRQFLEELAASGRQQHQKPGLGGKQKAGRQGSRKGLGPSTTGKEAPAGIADALGARAAASSCGLRKDALRSALSLMKGMRGSKSAHPKPTRRQIQEAAVEPDTQSKVKVPVQQAGTGTDRQASQSQGTKPSSNLRPQPLEGRELLTCGDGHVEDAQFDDAVPGEALSLSRSSGAPSPQQSGPNIAQHGQPWHSGVAVDQYFAAARRHLQSLAEGANDMRPGLSSSQCVELLVAKLDGDVEGLSTASKSTDLQQLGAESQATQPTLGTRQATQPKGSIAHGTSSLRLTSHLHSGPSSVPPQKASGHSKVSQPQQQQRSKPASSNMHWLVDGLENPQGSSGLALHNPYEVACDRHSGHQQQAKGSLDSDFLANFPTSMPAGAKEGRSEATGFTHNKRQKVMWRGPWESDLDGDILCPSVSAAGGGDEFAGFSSSHLHTTGSELTSTAERVKAAGVHPPPRGWQAPAAEEEKWLQGWIGRKAQRQGASLSCDAELLRREEEPAWLGSAGLAEEPLQHSPVWKCGRNGHAPGAGPQLSNRLQQARPQGTLVFKTACLEAAHGSDHAAPDVIAEEDNSLSWLASEKDCQTLQNQRLPAVPANCAEDQGRGLPSYLRLSPRASHGAGSGTANRGLDRGQQWGEPLDCPRLVATVKNFATSSHSLGSCGDPLNWRAML